MRNNCRGLHKSGLGEVRALPQRLQPSFLSPERPGKSRRMTLESEFSQNPIFYRAEPGGTGAEPERIHRFPEGKRIVRVAEPGGPGAGTGCLFGQGLRQTVIFSCRVTSFLKLKIKGHPAQRSHDCAGGRLSGQPFFRILEGALVLAPLVALSQLEHVRRAEPDRTSPLASLAALSQLPPVGSLRSPR